MKPIFFATANQFRAWLQVNHAMRDELWVGFYKRDSGKASITWPESVDEALSFGWIDGLRKSLGPESYMIRFSPRRTGSVWSAVNIKRAKELRAQGRMSPAGLKAFEARTGDRSAIYSYEQRKSAALDADDEKRFRENSRAWEFFLKQPAGYRRLMLYWITSAKKDETRQKRLGTLIAHCARGKRIDAMNPGKA